MSDDRYRVGIDISGPGDGPICRANIPKRPQPLTPHRYSPASPTECEQCDFIGPVESGFQGDLLELHRAMHQFGRTLLDPLVPIVSRINLALTRTYR